MSNRETEEATVVTPLGIVHGVSENGCRVFRRLRYAQPPIGDLRFRAPKPISPWAGIADCTMEGPMAPQLPSRLSQLVMGNFPRPQSEDCLHVDIWAPEGAEGLPVLVFIHGGAFMSGGGSLACYDGRAIAMAQNLVVVNVSYRLGVLGFLATDKDVPSNLGLRDVVSALKFISNSIESFGGDPDRITIAGQSAGAILAALVATNASCRGLFQRAVLMSLPFGMKLRTRDEAAAAAAPVLANRLGQQSLDPQALAQLPVESLLETQLEFLRSGPPPRGDVAAPFAPVIDDELVYGDLLSAYQRGETAWCDTVFGLTREEMAAFYIGDPALSEFSDHDLAQIFDSNYGKHGAAQLARARARRCPPSALAVLGDHYAAKWFTQPVFRAAEGHSRAGGKAFVYRFDWQSPLEGAGACHCIDLPFLFGNMDVWQDAPMLAGANRTELDGLSGSFQSAIAQFVRAGDPSRDDLPDWPRFDSERGFLSFDRLIESRRLEAVD